MRMAQFNLPLIAGAVIVLYLVSLFLSRQGKYLTVALHRKIWNAVLLISFIATLVFSLLNLVLFDYGIKVLPIDVNFLHVEFGVVLVLVAAFHALWHIPYFQQYLPKEKMKPAAVVPQQPAQEQKPPA